MASEHRRSAQTGRVILLTLAITLSLSCGCVRARTAVCLTATRDATQEVPKIFPAGIL